VTLDVDGNRTAVLKPEEEWKVAEDELALGNSKALNALFNEDSKNSALWLRMLGRFSKPHMKAQQR